MKEAPSRRSEWGGRLPGRDRRYVSQTGRSLRRCGRLNPRRCDDSPRLARPVHVRRLALCINRQIRMADVVLAHQCSANTMTDDVPEPPKNPETTPEVVATYCLPPSS